LSPRVRRVELELPDALADAPEKSIPEAAGEARAVAEPTAA